MQPEGLFLGSEGNAKRQGLKSAVFASELRTENSSCRGKKLAKSTTGNGDKI